MSGYTTNAVCPCGARYYIWKGDKFFVKVDVCLKCGASKDYFKVITERWVPTRVLYKPWTWLSGYWEAIK